MKTLEQLGISPAPWKVSCSVKTNGCIVDAEGIICASGAPHGYPSANTRLIAAAPDLYEALAAMLSCAEREAPFTAGSGMSLAMDMTRKAIKKAGGAS